MSNARSTTGFALYSPPPMWNSMLRKLAVNESSFSGFTGGRP